MHLAKGLCVTGSVVRFSDMGQLEAEGGGALNKKATLVPNLCPFFTLPATF